MTATRDGLQKCFTLLDPLRRLRAALVLTAVLIAALLVSCGGQTRGDMFVGNWIEKGQSPLASPSASAPLAQSSLLDRHGNVVLWVTNQSLALRRVDIAIEVDGQPVLAQDFDVGSQHTQKRFILRLSPGPHVLTARSIKGGASLKRRFSVDARRWIVVSYWHYTKAQGTPMPRQVRFAIRGKPVGFD